MDMNFPHKQMADAQPVDLSCDALFNTFRPAAVGARQVLGGTGAYLWKELAARSGSEDEILARVAMITGRTSRTRRPAIGAFHYAAAKSRGQEHVGKIGINPTASSNRKPGRDNPAVDRRSPGALV